MARIRRSGGDEAELGVGQVAARSGVAVSALHYYEAQGLIRSWRNAGNQRRYPRGVLRRVALIKVARSARHWRPCPGRGRPPLRTGSACRPYGGRNWTGASIRC